MADFQSGVNPVQAQTMPTVANPVDTATASGIQAAGNILGVLGSTAIQGATAAKTQKQVVDNANFMSNYSQDLLRIADLEQQGALKPDQALRQYRLRTARMIANHPLQQEEIFKTYGTIVEKAGLGQNVAKDYQQQQDNANTLRMNALVAAQKDGWGKPSDPPEVQQQLAEKHQQFLFAQSQMEQANALLDHKKKENELVSSGIQIQAERASLANQSISIRRNQLGLAQDQAKQQFLAGAKNLSDAYFGKWQQDTGNILKQVQSGTLKQEDAVRLVQDQLAAIHQQTGALAAGYDSTGSLEALTKPIDMLAQNTIDQITGKTSNEVSSNTLANILGTKSIQLLSNDPKFTTLVATSKMIPAGAGVLQENLGSAAIDLLKRNKVIPGDAPVGSDGSGMTVGKPGDPTHNDDPDHNKGVDQYMSLVKSGVSNINAGMADPDLKTEVDGNIQNILRGVGVYGPTASSPTELNSAIKFFADPQMGGYLTKNPELLHGDAAIQAKTVYEQDYRLSVLPLIQSEFLNAKVVAGYKVDSSSLATQRYGAQVVPDERASTAFIHPEFNGTGVTFVANDRTKGDTNREAQRLNREVAPVMNNLIRASAHFAGNTDYKTSYENLMLQIQPDLSEDPTPVKSGDEALKDL